VGTGSTSVFSLKVADASYGKGSVSFKYWPDAEGKTVVGHGEGCGYSDISMDGNISMGGMILVLNTGIPIFGNIKIDTAQYFFPLSYRQKYQMNGHTTINTKYKILPGCEVVVSEGAILTSSGQVTVYDKYADNMGANAEASFLYPTNKAGGSFVVNGQLDFTAGAIAGKITTTTNTSKISISNGVGLSIETKEYNNGTSGTDSYPYSATANVLMDDVYSSNKGLAAGEYYGYRYNNEYVFYSGDVATVTYKVGGNVVDEQLILNHDTAEIIAVNIPGYTSADGHWYTDENYTTQFAFTTAITKDITLYLKPNDYTLTYVYIMKGEDGIFYEVEDDLTGKITLTGSYNVEDYDLVDPEISEELPYVFGGWYIKNGSQYTMVADLPNTTGHLTIYGELKEAGYVISFTNIDGITIRDANVTVAESSTWQPTVQTKQVQDKRDNVDTNSQYFAGWTFLDGTTYSADKIADFVDEDNKVILVATYANKNIHYVYGGADMYDHVSDLSKPVNLMDADTTDSLNTVWFDKDTLDSVTNFISGHTANFSALPQTNGIVTLYGESYFVIDGSVSSTIAFNKESTNVLLYKVDLSKIYTAGEKSGTFTSKGIEKLIIKECGDTKVNKGVSVPET
ncbi:MAG: InlB B-repeat-containing protein, partial [Clostridia bacterium]|nr:InlB B-repeat-containing protein [Clostridia bacterium]